jgi:uncharacterized protein with von Willebrand factor type A (vWA) domain
MKRMYESPDHLASVIVSFCRFARSKGLPVGTQETLAALKAVKAVGISDWQLFAFALRTVLCSSQEQWEQFDQIFSAFWNSTQGQPDFSLPKPPAADSLARSKQPADSGFLLGLASGSSSAEDDGKMISGASERERLKKLDFSEVTQSDMSALEQLSLRLLWQMSIRLSRKMKMKSRGDRVDLRRVIRRSISHGGDPVTLVFKGKKSEKRRLVIFLDISGSMNLYSLFLVRFAYALQKHFRRVETFLFSTSVVEVSDVLRVRHLPKALRGLSQRAAGWSGGTKIGGSLQEFNRRYGRRVLSRNTVFMILSDGWDTGTPELLATELQNTKCRVEKVMWLNPLLGLKEYQPITRGITAALPHVDIFAPAHNLQSLLALEKYL